MKKINESKKALSLIHDEVLTRTNYWVFEANDVAKALGKLSYEQQRILDFAVSFIQRDSTRSTVFTTSIREILDFFNMNKSGANYKYVHDTFMALRDNANLRFVVEEDGHQWVMGASLLNYVKISDQGTVKFKFSDEVAPYLFELTDNFYSLPMSVLAQVRSKYTTRLLRLWQANNVGGKQSVVTLNYTMEEWQNFLFGDEVRHDARYFKRVLDKAQLEMGTIMHGIWFKSQNVKRGRTIVGFNLEIHDDKNTVIVI